MEYVLFHEEGLYDFRDVTLPDIYTQLLVTGSFDNEGIACIGAVENGQNIGALILEFHDEPMASVLSLYVLPAFRDRGIGSALISHAAAHMAQTMEFATKQFQFGLRLEYALNRTSTQKFRHFLDKNGFKVQEELAQISVVTETGFKKLPAPAADIRCAANLMGEEADEFTALLDQNGFTADAQHCFICGGPEAPEYLLVAEAGGEQDFYISSIAIGKNQNADRYRSLLAKTVQSLRKECPQPVLIAEDVRNAHPEVWQELADEGESAVRAVALLLADFSEEEKA